VSTQYYVKIGRRAFGPFPMETIQETIARGKIEKTTLLSLDQQTWKEADKFPGLFSDVTNVKIQKNDRQHPIETITESAFNIVPQINSSREWFASVDGQTSLGSFTTRELFDLFRSGKFSSETLVWRQGDSTSQKLGEHQEIRQEFESFQQVAPDPFKTKQSAENETQKSKTEEKRSSVSLNVAYGTKRVTERLAQKIKTRFLSAWICVGVMETTFIIAVFFQRRGLKTFSLTDFSLGTFVCLIAGLAFLGFVVFGASFLHAFWSSIPSENARANPDEAVAFLFIPGFRLYGIFQALYGGAVDANDTLNQYDKAQNDEKRTPLVSPGWALSTSIFFDLGGPFNPVSGLFFLLCLGVTTVQMKNVAIKLDSLNAARLQTDQN